MVAEFNREGQPVTRVDLEIFGLIKMLSNGSTVRACGLPIHLLPLHMIGGIAVNQLSIIFFPQDDIMQVSQH